MLSGAGALLQVAWTKVYSLDPFGGDDDEEGEPPKGSMRLVPQFLRVSGVRDLLHGCALLGSLGSTSPCGGLLRIWVLGGVILGFPISQLVRSVAAQRPVYSSYRLVVSETRGAGDPADFQIDGLQLFGQFHQPLERSRKTHELKDANRWVVSLADGPELLTGYQVITSAKSHSSSDPRSWALEGSVDGTNWVALHSVSEYDLPRGYPLLPETFEDLPHLTAATRSFRLAFLLEALSNVLSFAWLVAGTVWVNAGSYTCPDEVPLLWWACFLEVVATWSLLGIATTGMIISAVAMVVLGR